MNKSVKRTTAKASICISGALLLFTVIVFPVLVTCLGYQFEEIESLWLCLWIVTFLSGFTMVVLLTVAGDLSPEDPAEKAPMHFRSYDQFFDHLHQRLITNGYTEVRPPKQPCGLELMIYVHPGRLWELDCIAVIRAPQIVNELLAESNATITETLKSHLNKTYITETVNIISLFCVDRLTPTLRNLVNSPIRQGLKNGRLPIGISFGSNTIYIPKHGSGFLIGRYYRLKRLWKSIIRTGDGLREPY